MSPIRIAVLLAVICALALAVHAWVERDRNRGSSRVAAPEPHEQPLAPEPGEHPLASTPSEERAAPAAEIGRRGEPPRGAVRFPDGTWLPALNGVTAPPPFQGWDPKRPYSPVVGIVGSGPVKWYAHADGSKSTVRRFPLESEGGVELVTAWGVLHPADAKPIDPASERGTSVSR